MTKDRGSSEVPPTSEGGGMKPTSESWGRLGGPDRRKMNVALLEPHAMEYESRDLHRWRGVLRIKKDGSRWAVCPHTYHFTQKTALDCARQEIEVPAKDAIKEGELS